MSQRESIINIIAKYDLDEQDQTNLLNFHEESYQMYVDQCILEDTVKQYETISDIIVHHVNTNQMNEFKEKLKHLYDPFETDGWISLPDNLYEEQELGEFRKKRQTQLFNINEKIVGDVPSDPEQL